MENLMLTKLLITLKKGGGKMMRSKDGFTLIELLIVVLILGIIAAVAVPQFGSSTDDAKLSTLDSTLSHTRTAIERYYHEHNSTYPGAKLETDGSAVTTVAECEAAFEKQLTLYSEISGVTANVKAGAAKYGPYIKEVKLPKNPFTTTNTILCDITENDITVATSDTTNGEAWMFYMKTGRFIANDGAHDSN
jgi:prepilin-type N-terminal cleavage/methylation domain-containing protein